MNDQRAVMPFDFVCISYGNSFADGIAKAYDFALMRLKLSEHTDYFTQHR